MKWQEFDQRYPDEASCKAEWKRYREEVGVFCPRCGCKVNYWKSDKECYECKHCGYRQSLRANTVMHGSQLPFRYWFVAIQMLTTIKKTVSAVELQRQLGHKYYPPIWAMLHKLRAVMGKRDSLYTLDGLVEMTESNFTVELSAEARRKRSQQGGKAAKQSDNASETSDKVAENDGKIRKTVKVLVLAETHQRTEHSRPLKSSDKPTAVKYVKMFVVDNLTPKEIDQKAIENVYNSTYILPIRPKIHDKLLPIVKAHLRNMIGGVADGVDDVDSVVGGTESGEDKLVKRTKKAPPWVHMAIKNAKRVIDGIYHDITPKYLQNYLNEFCYKFNRRNFGEAVFNRMMITAVSYKNEFRYSVRQPKKNRGVCDPKSLM